ncbi:hypothetical protein [Pseudomonas kitaguniensis]|uniref:hypothetical protein n=1 Tax=Pseudomonas kitaguniensis TaxID=2607908 RepID=UPI003CFCED6A
MSTVPVSYDDLPTEPYSAYPSVDLTKTKYPEKAVWGLGVKGIFPNLVIVIEPWSELSINDYYAVHIKDLNNPAASDILKGVQSRYNLFVDGHKVPEGVNTMVARVVRAASRQESRSQPVDVLFKTTLPGGYDQRTWEPWHSELKLSVEGLPEGEALTPDRVQAGLWCLIEKYANIRQNDRISLEYGGIEAGEEHDEIYTVSPADVARSGPIRIKIPDRLISGATKSGALYVRFKVVDVVGNASGGKYTYSKPYALLADVDPSLYPSPLFTVDGEEAIQVDLDIQSRSVFELLATVPRNVPAPNPRHTIVAVITILRENSPAETVRLPAVPDRNLRGETITVPKEIIALASQARFQVLIEVRDNSGKLVGKSGSTTVYVVGTAINMPAPKVSPIEGALIPRATDVTITIPTYQPHDPSKLETLVIEQGRAGGGGLLFTQSQFAGPQGGSRALVKDDLKQFEDQGLFSVYYRTDSGTGLPSAIRESDRLQAEIGNRVADLPKAILQRAISGNIDPADVKGTDALFSCPYARSMSGNVVHWTVIGVDADSSTSGHFTVNAATQGPGLPALLIAFDKKVLLGSVGGMISISYSVESVGASIKTLRSEIANFTVGPAVKLGLPVILEADKVFQDQLHAKDVLNGATVQASVKTLVGDEIIFRWAGEFGISTTEVRVRGNPNSTILQARIPPAIIALAIRETGNTITVDYRFTRGQITYRSEPLLVKLLLTTALPSPTLNNVSGAIFPLFALGKEARIKIPAWILIQAGQRKFLTIKGTLADGTNLEETLYSGDKVTADEVANGVSVLAPLAKLLALKEDSVLSLEASVSYAQIDDAITRVPFGKREYRVQTIPTTLPAPAFDSKVGAALTVAPLSYVQGASVTVAYAGMTTLQKIELQWIFPDGTKAGIAVQSGVSGGRVTFPISSQIIGQSVFKSIALRYRVTTGTQTVLSEIQLLTVETINVSKLPRALINNVANDGILNLQTISGDLTLALAVWPFIFLGQRVSVTLRSKLTSPLELLAFYPITAAEVKTGVANLAVPRQWLKTASESIEVDVSVTFDGSETVSNAVVFPNTRYSVKQSVGVVGTVEVGQQPHDVVITSDGALAYVTNLYSHSVSVIDLRSRTVIYTIPGIQSAYQSVLSSDNSRLYVGNFYSKSFTVIDTVARRPILTIPIEGGDAIEGLVLNGDNSRLFVACSANSFISVHDAKTGASLNRISVTKRPIGMALNPEKTQVFIATSTEVVIINASGLGGVVGRIAGFTTPQDFAFTPSNLPSPRVYVANNSTVAIVDVRSNTLVKTLPGFRYSWGIAMNPRAQECYVGSVGPSGQGAYRDSLFVIDTVTEQVIRRHVGFDNIANIAFTPDGSLALIVNNAAGTVTFFNT